MKCSDGAAALWLSLETALHLGRLGSVCKAACAIALLAGVAGCGGSSRAPANIAASSERPSSSAPASIASGSGSSAPQSLSAKPSGSAIALPKDGCTLLTAAEVSGFLGSSSTCTDVHRTTTETAIAGADWKTLGPGAGADLSAAVSYYQTPEDHPTFEENAGTKANAGAKIVPGLGDDAVLIMTAYPPAPTTSGSIHVLMGHVIIDIAVDRGVPQNEALATALTAAARRLSAAYA